VLDELPSSVREHIEQLECVRRDFVANVSHELRTPLTVIRGYLEALIKKDMVELDDLKKIYWQMHQHSLRMESIIDDLLFLSRIENEDEPNNEKDKIGIADILRTIKLDAERVSADKCHYIQLNVDDTLSLRGSEEELKSLFSNIVINAVKYTPAQGDIVITWEKVDNKAIFSVKDTGIGIEKKHLPRLTERFYRVDKARSRASGGTGLGLAIAKHVLMSHQGELAIESELGVGSRFICTFPSERILQS